MIGPLIRGTQCIVINGHVEDAVNKGAKLLCGATHKDQYYWPTVLSGVTPDMRIFHEESFGPVTSIIKVKGHEQALEIANATDYGLSAGVITNDMQKALDLAFGLDSGMVHLNDCTVSDEPHVPFWRRQERRLWPGGRSLLHGGNDGGEVDHHAKGTTRIPDVDGSGSAWSRRPRRAKANRSPRQGLTPLSKAHAIVAKMRSISANASFFSDGVISEAWIPLRTIVTISSR